MKRKFTLPDGAEVRFRPAFEMRKAEDGSATLRGHALTFDQPYDLGTFWEQVAPEAVDRALDGADIHALWNHDESQVLGRTKSGTLRLGKDKTGLSVEIDLPTSAASQREAVERGDVDAMSFAFYTIGESWDEEGGPGGMPLRTLTDLDIFEVSPVTFPANPNTDVAMRSMPKKAEEPKVVPDLARLEIAKRK